ncbi:MAG: FAD:protein FMN transferase [Clostridia bacterium]|nr:FAD:protein FMN transferase [Clostridia bacterium]
MKKITSLGMALALVFLVGCENAPKTQKSSRFLLDTIVTLEAECDEQTLNEAFSLCSDLENLLSKTKKQSDVYKLNKGGKYTLVKDDTLKIIERSLYYSQLSNGLFDITVCPVSNLWDFEGTALPDKKEIAEALKNVTYENIKTDGNYVSLNGSKIDLGGIAKGYIADKLLSFFKEKNIKSGIINLGGNVIVFGGEEKNVGIKKPFSDNEISATLKIKNKAVVTSGIYERFIEKDNIIYHHILNPKTGYGAQTDLYSATVIGDTSLDCDALSTVCILLGKEKAEKLIEKTENTEAVFIDKNGKISHTSGIYGKNNYFYLRG